MSGPVVGALPMWIVGGQPLIAMAVYDPDDPWAVHLEFRDDDKPVCWTVGRDLLHDGMHKPAGDDQVKVRPAGPDVVITLIGCEPGGSPYVSTSHVDLTVERVALNAFLCRTFAAVPRGEEQVNWDAIIDRCRQETS